jgi:hypothetical protein
MKLVDPARPTARFSGDAGIRSPIVREGSVLWRFVTNKEQAIAIGCVTQVPFGSMKTKASNGNGIAAKTMSFGNSVRSAAARSSRETVGTL